MRAHTNIWHDLRHAWRAVRQSAGFAAWVIGSLAIGMSVTITALALLNATMIMPFPAVHDQRHLVRVSVSRNCGWPNCRIRMASAADYAALREGLTGLEGLAAHASGEVAAALPDPQTRRAIFASANYFSVLGVLPAMGRTFEPSDEHPGSAVAIIAHHVWTQQFNADPGVLGEVVRIGNEFVHIVGVAPQFFVGIDRVRPGGRAPDIWLPLWLADRLLPLSPDEQRRQQRDVYFVGRLRDDVDVAALTAEADVVSRRLALSHSQSSSGALAEVRRVWRVDPRSWRYGLMFVMPIPILVLAIACVNAANLMLARGSQQQREIAIRLAIGAGRGRIVRQLLIESAAHASGATVFGLVIAWWGLQLVSAALDQPIPLDRTVLALTVLTAFGTTVAFGLMPAIRVSAQRPSTRLGSGHSGDATPRESRMRSLLVGVQVTLSIGLLATASQFVSMVRSQAVSAGTPGDRLLLARFDLQPFKLPAHEAEAFYQQLLGGASRLTGVEAAGLARHTAVWTFGRGKGPGSIVVWRPSDAPNDGRIVIGGYAAGDLFGALGLRVTSGRSFGDADRRARPQVAIVNDSAARTLEGPVIGQTLRVAPRNGTFDSSVEVRIVGIVDNALDPRHTENDTPAPKVYLPSPIEPESALTLYLRTTHSATTLAQPVRDLVNRIAPLVPVAELGSLDDINQRAYGHGLEVWLAKAATVIGVMGVLLATAGLYGLSSYVLAMRSRELAVRMAIGAAPRNIVTMIFGRSMRLALIGLGAGGTAAIAVSRWIQSEYHGVTGIDPFALVASALLFLATMVLASAIPALRASRLDPVQHLKDT
jgi:predicted permease